MGETLALLTALSWSIGIFPFTEAARRLGPNSVNHIRLLVALVLLVLASLLMFNLNPFSTFGQLPLPAILWLGLSGIVGLTLGDFFGFTSFAILGPRIGSVFTTLAPGAALAGGMLMLNEKLNIIGLAGILITMAGVLWTVLSKRSAMIENDAHGTKIKGWVYGILAALCQGGGLVFARKGMDAMPHGFDLHPIMATILRMGAGALSLYTLTILTRKFMQIHRPIFRNEQGGLKFMLAGTLFGPVIGVSLSMYAVSYLNPSVAQTIFSLVPVLVLPLNYLFYKEKITLLNLAGASVAIFGVVVLIWRDKF